MHETQVLRLRLAMKLPNSAQDDSSFLSAQDDKLFGNGEGIRSDRRHLRLPGRGGGSCWDLAVKGGFKGFGPGLAEGGERGGDEGLAIDGNFKAVAAGGTDADG